MIRVLEVPVVERVGGLQANPQTHLQGKDAAPRRRSDRKCFQEKPLSPSNMTRTVPQTDTGGRAEYAQALERTRVKELGK